MKPLSTRFVAAAALALGAFAAATAAHAGRGELHVTVGIQPASSYYVQPASSYYVQPAPVYVQPRSVYTQPWPVYTQPRPVYAQPAPYGYSRGGGWDDRRWQRRGRYGDIDHDGIRNRNDRDRDGDGVGNRRDRAPHNPYRY